MRSFLGYFMASLCITICTLSENRLLASDSSPLNKVGLEKLAALTNVRQEKLKAAEERYAAVNVAFQAGTVALQVTRKPFEMLIEGLSSETTRGGRTR